MGDGLTRVVRSLARRRWPESLVAVLASSVSLSALGSLELWGKREQRAAAEALDSLENGHWLVAEIQGRPRLEKPPLPRWAIAAFMTLTGRRDEWAARMPAASPAWPRCGGAGPCAGEADRRPRPGLGLGHGALHALAVRDGSPPGGE